jgi:hypothetical protein
MVISSGKRLSLIVITACLALAAVSADVFVFTHLDHDCTGEDCAVCLQIEIAQNLIELMGRIGLFILVAGIFASALRLIRKSQVFSTVFASPILLKVKFLS